MKSLTYIKSKVHAMSSNQKLITTATEMQSNK